MSERYPKGKLYQVGIEINQPVREILDSNSRPIAWVRPYTAFSQLIEAAPDLLEALRPFANYACKHEGSEFHNTCKCNNCKARDAIAKAEGKE